MSEVDKIIQEHPDLKYMLSPNVIECFAAPPGRPFRDDLDYLRTVEALFALRHKMIEGRRILEDGPIGYREKLDLETMSALLDAVGRVREALLTLCRERLQATGDGQKLPRLLRVAERLNLSEKEVEGLQYMLLYYSSGEIGGGIRGTLDDDLRAVAKHADFNTRELLDFVNPSREHVKQGLFELEKSLTPSVFESDFRMADEVVKALMGLDLTGEEFLKIDKTALAEVLAEEPGFTPVVPPEVSEAGGAGSDIDEDEDEDEELERALRRARAAGDMDEERDEERDEDEGDERAEFDLHGFLRDEIARETGTSEDLPSAGEGAPSGGDAPEAAAAAGLAPYRTDLEYLEDQFQFLATRIKIRKLEGEDSRLSLSSERSRESVLRELHAKERMQQRKCETRLAATREAGDWMPRLERLAEARELKQFDKFVLLTLVGMHLSQDMARAAETSFYRSMEVKDILEIWCSTLHDRISCRHYFYKNATLVKEGMIRLDDHIGGDLAHADVEVDRRMLDFVVGLDTESSELVEGSHLYSPTVKLEQVVLPDEQKKLIMDTVSNFNTFREVRRKLGFEEVISYGGGIVMLFFGPSGTGKTMMANALANHLGKKVFLINFPSLGGMYAGEVAKFIFREARIQDAIVFFDECESIFEAREMGGSEVGVLLTEIERHDGLVVMATNRPFDLDEAMHRRITLAIEFRQPDPHLRESIWRNHIPEGARTAPDVDLGALARKYELTGGFIKNAVLSALSIAVARDGEKPCIRMEDLDRGAKLQLRSRLRMADFDRRVAPTHGLEELVLPKRLREGLEQLVSFEKARNVLFGQWGFDEKMTYGVGTAALFYGPPGTGKSIAAEAVAYEIGKPLKVVNCAELISKYVGDTPKNIEALFHDARNNDAILVFDEAEGLFGARTSTGDATDRYANIDVGLLLYHMERHAGVVILTTNIIENVDEAFFRRLKFRLEFPMPDRDLREALWRTLLPSRAPVADDVDFAGLAKGFEIAGGNIKNAVFKAAARAALRPEDARTIGTQDLMDAAEQELAVDQSKTMGFHPDDV